MSKKIGEMEIDVDPKRTLKTTIQVLEYELDHKNELLRVIIFFFQIKSNHSIYDILSKMKM